ncbi:MAG: UDP-N-acetylmuramoyl-L-alanyl-D-glutamate--2,6-diaminopimelate ligase [Candidatus Omnitrophica bacterium]|nr:UDP-N-acetylmuramoyl-L-alanyl-D-glutamate--2,6-diaminopimelate ligase [Candidatus Omnitrophota bacterium]
MRIQELIKILNTKKDYSGSSDFQVRGLACNSKDVRGGFVFVAIKGNRDDGKKFIADAINKGAKAIIAGSSAGNIRVPQGVLLVRVNDTRKALAELAARFYKMPSKKLKVVGITGTNGKTTITYLLEAMLKEKRISPAVVGTISYRFKDKLIPAKNTTPGPLELQSMFADMLKSNIRYVIMEVSSHALDQDRVAGINFHSAIFTNLTQDHLDYHKTLEKYFQSKARMFKGLSPDAFAVLNNDDAFSRRLKRYTRAGIITYGIKNKSDITARDIKFDCSHTGFKIITPRGEIKIKSPLIGRHNVYNVLAAFAWGFKAGIALAGIKSAIEKFSSVPGRLEKIDTRAGFSVFVDYAHTEDALTNVINTLRELTRDRIIVVFGCGGERDRVKRPKMGRVVSELSDYAVITSDNPRSERPQAIIDDIKRGIRKKNFCIIPGRLEAIKKTLAMAHDGDIVLVAGKGHENYQILNDKTIHFDDREAVRECLRSMNY